MKRFTRLATVVAARCATARLVRADAAATAPYASEELTWSNGGVTLSGTLTLPQEPHKGPFRALVLVSGSGAQNRDSQVFGFKLFPVLAEHLTRHGIAGYDDRGVGGKRPTLALFGGKDVQAPADEHRSAFEAAFADAGHVRPQVVTYPEANHLFQSATTGRPEEYASLARSSSLACSRLPKVRLR